MAHDGKMLERTDDVFLWPETQAFLSRIGVNTQAPIARIKLVMDFRSRLATLKTLAFACDMTGPEEAQ